MNLDKNKVKDILVITLFSVSIIFFVYCLFFVKEVKLYSEDLKNEVTEDENHILDNLVVSNEIFVDNMNLLFENYTGELSRLDVSKKIRQIVLNELFTLKSIKISKKYFKENSNDIALKYGITNYIDFEKLYNSIQNYEQNVTAISIIENTVNIGQDISSFKVKVKFESGNETILKFVINNKVSTNVSQNPDITVLTQD